MSPTPHACLAVSFFFKSLGPYTPLSLLRPHPEVIPFPDPLPTPHHGQSGQQFPPQTTSWQKNQASSGWCPRG